MPHLRPTSLRRGVTGIFAALAVALAALTPVGVGQLSSAAAPAGAAICPYNGEPVVIYNYRGCKMRGSRFDSLNNYAPRSQEWFLVAPDRRIFHIWPSSGGWREMPNGGRADGYGSVIVCNNGTRMVAVFVNGYRYTWGSYTRPGWKTWTRWTYRGFPTC